MDYAQREKDFYRVGVKRGPSVFFLKIDILSRFLRLKWYINCFERLNTPVFW